MTQTFYIKVSAKKLDRKERMEFWNKLEEQIRSLPAKTQFKIVCTEGTE